MPITSINHQHPSTIPHIPDYKLNTPINDKIHIETSIGKDLQEKTQVAITGEGVVGIPIELLISGDISLELLNRRFNSVVVTLTKDEETQDIIIISLKVSTLISPDTEAIECVARALLSRTTGVIKQQGNSESFNISDRLPCEDFAPSFQYPPFQFRSKNGMLLLKHDPRKEEDTMILTLTRQDPCPADMEALGITINNNTFTSISNANEV